MLTLPTSGHAPGLPAVTRRALLHAAPALAVATLDVSPALASTAADPLPALYAQMMAAEAAWLAFTGADEGTPPEKAAWAEFRRLEDLIEETVATSPEGVAAQVAYMQKSYASGATDDPRPTVDGVPFAFLDVILEGLGRIGQ